MPKYVQDKIKYSDQIESENTMTNMEMIKRNQQLLHRNQVTRSQNVDKKTVKTTKNSNKKKFMLPPMHDNRSPAPKTDRKLVETGIEGEGESLSEIYALTQQMGVIGGNLRNRNKSVDINSVPSTYKKEMGAFKLNNQENLGQDDSYSLS